jgi:hypothetical protein
MFNKFTDWTISSQAPKSIDMGEGSETSKTFTEGIHSSEWKQQTLSIVKI